MVEITDKVAIPENITKYRAAMKTMDVGHSFPVPNGEEKEVRYIAWDLFHKEGDDGKPVSEKRFKTKRDPLDLENFRCWRVK
ncbi:hypothetical protein [Sphingobacterium multivorum]|uniref:hypothetical protein n=1 Tax=Sphingobacterium multivorum TaxID=28454 RepID=UPI003DA6C9AC